MKKELLYHSFYIRRPRHKTFTDRLFIYKISDEGYHVYDSTNPKEYQIYILQGDYEKYVNNLPECDGSIKIVKYSQKTIDKILEEIDIKLKEL